jgi:DNA anti-recombination protein RmuC
VYALTVVIKGNTIMLDFENPERVIGDIFQAVGKEMGKASKDLDKAATAFAKGMEGFAKGMNEGLKENK